MELGDVKDDAITGLVDDCMVSDPKSKKRYVSARRLFNSLDDIRRRRAARKAN